MSSKDYIWEWINTAGMTSHLGRFFLFLPDPSRDHLSTCFASFPVATVQGIPGHGSKHVFCLGHLQQNIFIHICFTDFKGVCRRSSNLFIQYAFLIWNGSRNVSKILGIPKKDPAGMWALIIMSHQVFHPGNFWKHPRIKTENRESCRGTSNDDMTLNRCLG